MSYDDTRRRTITRRLCIAAFGLSGAVLVTWTIWLAKNLASMTLGDWQLYVPLAVCALAGFVVDVWRQARR
ncbi:hypothetical protein [Acidisphaera sp. L21]|uniref:hypothetical protein n=1 Tax=Acidisphaera sp. L21 TaxID=1641851 RepID=UPI00131B3D70|nr:hypothetical protein [Acidisphaera sp. L21]